MTRAGADVTANWGFTLAACAARDADDGAGILCCRASAEVFTPLIVIMASWTTSSSVLDEAASAGSRTRTA